MNYLKELVTVTQRAALLLRVLNNKPRQELLRFIVAHPDTCVTKIVKGLHWEQSVVSQHLTVLRDAGLVEGRREGKFVYYTAIEPRMDTIKKAAYLMLDESAAA